MHSLQEILSVLWGAVKRRFTHVKETVLSTRGASDVIRHKPSKYSRGPNIKDRRSQTPSAGLSCVFIVGDRTQVCPFLYTSGFFPEANLGQQSSPLIHRLTDR